MTMPISSPDNYSILKGKLYFKKVGETQWTDLGNAPEFTYEPTVETLEHFSSRSGVRSLDKVAVTQVGANLSLTLDELTADNLKLALLGSSAAMTQTSATSQSLAVENVQVGMVIDVGKLDISNVAIDDGEVAPVSYVLGTHYLVDARAGLITIIAKPETAGTDIEIGYDAGAIDANAGRSVIAILKEAGQLEGAFMCVGANSVGKRFKITCPRVELLPSGAIGFISDEWASITLTGRALEDATNANYPFGRVEELA